MSEPDFYTPDELEPGVYANVVTVWHTPYEVTIDLGAIQPGGKEARVVSRARLHPAVALNVMRAIGADLDVYEAEWGEIVDPRRLSPEDE